ncbi:SMODS domain-containing nucleotidyltransferase [Agromyces aureus]
MTQFLSDISVTDYQKTSIVNARKDRVVENLTAAFPPTSDLPFSRAILMGSAAKGTIVRPIDDIDVLAVFSNANGAWNTYRSDSQAFLYRVRRAYNGLSAAQVGARGQAVRIFFNNGGHVDVAPVFSHGNDIYGLPGGDGRWIDTAPTVANAWFAKKNADLSYNLAPLVRLLKKWNNAHSKRLRSFHLETIAASTFSTLGNNRQSAMANFFEWAPSHLNVRDPGGQSGALSGYLSWSGRQEVTQALASASDRARKANEAEARGDHDEAKRLWRIILGSSFPN